MNSAAAAGGPDAASKVSAMPVFVLRLKAPRPRFAQTLTDAEREVMGRHGAHWRPYLERGDMVAFGPVLTDEDSYGSQSSRRTTNRRYAILPPRIQWW